MSKGNNNNNSSFLRDVIPLILVPIIAVGYRVTQVDNFETGEELYNAVQLGFFNTLKTYLWGLAGGLMCYFGLEITNNEGVDKNKFISNTVALVMALSLLNNEREDILSFFKEDKADIESSTETKTTDLITENKDLCEQTVNIAHESTDFTFTPKSVKLALIA